MTKTTQHAVVIAGAGPTGLMLAGELALCRVDVAVVEPREDQKLAGARAGGLHSRTIEMLDQRGIADRFLSRGQIMQVAGFAMIPLDISDFPYAAMMSGLDIRYDLGAGHALLGRRMPDLDLVTERGPRRVFTLLHDARPVLLNLGEPGALDIASWADRVERVDARYAGVWELPVLGNVAAPSAVLIRPDGYVAWVSDGTDQGLCDALACWFGPPGGTQAR